MLAQVDARQLVEMQAEFDLAPWDEDEAWLRTGTLAAATVNFPNGSTRWRAPADFIPTREPPKPPPTPEELRAKVQTMISQLRRK